MWLQSDLLLVESMFKLDYQNKVLPINVLEKLYYYSASDQNNAALVNTRETDPKLMNAVWCESQWFPRISKSSIF